MISFILQKLKLIITVFSFLLIGFFSIPGSFSQDANYVPGELLIQLKGDHKFEEIQKFIPEISLLEVLSGDWKIYWASFDNNLYNEYLLLEKVRRHPFINVAQFNHIVQSRGIPDDPQFGTMWGLHNTGQSGGTLDADIDAPEAWDIATGGLTASGDTIVVAVIDGGFDLSHTDLNFWKNYREIAGNGIDDDLNGYIDDVNGWNAYNNSGTITSNQHGTHVAGTIGAKGNNTSLVTGVNWNIKLMAIQGSGGNEAIVVQAYNYAYNQRKVYNQTNGDSGAFVVCTNASFGVDLADPNNYPLWCGIYDTLGTVGILSAGATANSNYNVDTQGDMPTACPSDYLVTVTNTTNTDAKNSGAGYGATSIDLGAPGTQILSTYPASTSATLTGTSMATPHVAGAIGLMYAAACPELIQDYRDYPDSIAIIMKGLLLNNVDVKPSLVTRTLSEGRLNIHKTLLAIQGYCSGVGFEEALLAVNKLQINSLYPNPANKWTGIEYSLPGNSTVIITVTDILGKVVKTINHQYGHGGINSHKMDLSGLIGGIYFVVLNVNGQKSNVMKVVMY